MFKTKLFLTIAIFALLVAACAPALAEEPTPPPIKTDEPTIPVTGVAVVESVDVQILESMPVQVRAVIRGQLPDAGCTSISAVNQVRNGSTISLTLVTTTDPLALCAQMLTPFEETVSLDVSSLPAGQYTVDVQGIQQTFELSADNTSAFQQTLVEALNARDYDALKAMMDPTFMIGYWQSEGTSHTPDQAVEQLQLNLLNSSSPITADPDRDLTALLGMDPVTIVGPGVTEVSPLLVSGLGAEGRDEAILFTARRADGSPYWYGMLFARDGFASSGTVVEDCTAPVDVSAADGNISYNGISFKLDPAIVQPISARTCAASPDGQVMFEAYPAYTEFFFPTFNKENVEVKPEIRVFEITGDMTQYTAPLNMLPELEGILSRQAEPIDWFKAPLSVRQKYLPFESGAGVRGLMQYMQDYFFFSNNGLLYEFNGLTQDGRHFVRVRYPVSVPFLMELQGFSLPPVNLNPQAIPVPAWSDDFDQQRQTIEAYNTEAVRRFEQMSDGEAQPDLAVLDGLVQSMRVDQP